MTNRRNFLKQTSMMVAGGVVGSNILNGKSFMEENVLASVPKQGKYKDGFMQGNDRVGQPLPISFVYGGKPSHELIAGWKKEYSEVQTDDTTLELVYTLTDPVTGLEVKVKARMFLDTPGIDWTVYFTNTGSKNTPILELVRPLDMTVTPASDDAAPMSNMVGLMPYAPGDSYSPDDKKLPILNTIKGTSGFVFHTFNGLNEFQPMSTFVRKGKKHVFGMEWYGMSSREIYSPFFELSWNGGGVVTAIGWTGHWTACVEGLDDGRIAVSAGMAAFHSYLKPKESIRSPRVMQVFWDSDDESRGYNLFRQAMLKHIVPQKDGKPHLPPIASSSPYEYLASNHDNQIDHIENIMDGLGFEVYWLDAWWHRDCYPAGMGNYTFPIEKSADPDRFPHGIKPISDLAHAKGYGFLLWFSHEMVAANSFLIKEHPEFLIQHGGIIGVHAPLNPEQGATYNLADPDAREYITRFMNTCIKEWKINIWRTDCGPTHIQFMDTDPDRKGIFEAHYIEGLYRMWDDLLKNNPGLMIDNCWGGGTRIDLETCARSIPLWRTDSDIWIKDLRKPILHQNINCSLNRYLPFHPGHLERCDPYHVRSAFNGGVACGMAPTEENERKQLARGIKECKRLQKYMHGDFYRLIYQSGDEREWCAYQYHLPKEEAGCILLFRRDASPYNTTSPMPKGVTASANYELNFYESYDLSKTLRMSGGQFAEISVEIKEKPGSLLIEYKKV